MSDRAYERASEVQQLLTETATHRSAGPVEPLIAATAERKGLIVLCETTTSRRWPQLPASQSSSSPTCSPALRRGVGQQRSAGPRRKLTATDITLGLGPETGSHALRVIYGGKFDRHPSGNRPGA